MFLMIYISIACHAFISYGNVNLGLIDSISGSCGSISIVVLIVVETKKLSLSTSPKMEHLLVMMP